MYDIGQISGYVNDECQWTYSVWDGAQWVDVGPDRNEAANVALSLSERIAS